MSTLTRKQRLEAMLSQEPNDVELRYMVGMEYLSEGDDAGALARFDELIAQFPDYPHAYHQGARLLQRMNRVAEARDWLERGIPIARKKGDDHAAGEMQGLLEGLD